jgi:peptide-methionine (S)-S-oxide reductase
MERQPTLPSHPPRSGRTTGRLRPGPALSLLIFLATVGSGFAAPTPEPTASAGPASASGAAETRARAIFAGGCFWCLEKPFDDLDGVLATTSGYSGGQIPRPTYEQVSSGGTGHIEVVAVDYDPSKITYEELLEEFCDKGSQYTSAIFVADEDQKLAAESSKATLLSKGRLREPIATRIVPAAPFWEAEDYHQDYYRKNPIRYSYYRRRCGRDQRLAEIWGKTPD